MNIVVTTGCIHSGWDAVLATLQSAGLKPVEERFCRLLDRIYEEAGITDPLGVRQPLRPDSDIAQAADELLGDGSGIALLGDSRNVWLLDQWAEQWPEARFLLFYTNPESAVGHGLGAGLDPAVLLEGWQAADLHLLRFLRRYRRRALLLNAEAASVQADALLDACRRIGLELDRPERWEPVADRLSSIERLLATVVVARRPDLQSLQMELEASAVPLGDMPAAVLPDETQLLEDYLRRRERERRLRDELEAALRRQESTEQALLEQSAGRDEAQAKLEEAEGAYEGLNRSYREAREENELLLLQLHQVQEELEHYFLKCQELEMQVQRIDSFLKERHPEFCSAGAMTILKGNQAAPFRNLNCLFEQVEQGGRTWGKVNVKLLDTQGQPGLELRKGGKDIELPLQHWADIKKDEGGRFVILRPGEKDAVALFARMSTTDWLLVNGLAELLAYRLRMGRFERGKNTEAFAVGPWRVTAKALCRQLAQLPPVLRYDSVALREVHVSPGYEHLWFEFSNVHYDDRLLPQLRFKLAAKEVKPGEEFTRRAALLLREQEGGVAPFDAWPPAQSDQHGPLLSLEFGGELNQAQQADWNSLTVDDRGFLRALLAALPAALGQLEPKVPTPERPWAHWKRLIETMRSVLAEAAPAKPAGEKAAVVEQVESPKKAEKTEKTEPAKSAAAPTAPAKPVRFAGVSMTEVSRRPDYEHLRLEFKDLRWGERAFPTYGFRLAAPQVRGGRLGEQLVLAFRTLGDGNMPLECWPTAAQDEYGPVLRLAFGGSLGEAQKADWARLTANDKALVDALVRSLPSAIKQLRQAKLELSIERDWADWENLVARQVGGKP